MLHLRMLNIYMNDSFMGLSYISTICMYMDFICKRNSKKKLESKIKAIYCKVLTKFQKTIFTVDTIVMVYDLDAYEK